jgi:hypothetical protein
MIVDTRPERGIGKEGNQVKLPKTRHKTLSALAMSPTTSQPKIFLIGEDYELKARMRRNNGKAISDPACALLKIALSCLLPDK